MSQHILLIEDDLSIAEMLLKALTKEGYNLTTAYDGEEGLIAFERHTYDLVLVDLMMPKVDGMEVIRQIRTRSAVPILIMSAKDSDVDKALGLGFGADDYVAKPFSMLEMTARIQSAIRRSTTYARLQQQEEQPQAQVLTYGNLRIDFDHFTVIRDGNEIQLTAKESDILKLFASNPNRVFTKAQLYGFIWKDDYMGDENVINVHIRRLREKIEEDPSHPVHIKTLWGIGYKWENG
ncbi:MULTISPECIES: response regulator transcription factor [Paenibacillus]|uniref:response regulator transcription factor n=1 Tax=Paenibacillus TaxID=44249 RepID=UPI0008CC11DF|nr:response regulator transcription factor [Paenibacillus polymyxa]MDN4076757.1 response regulator transcription factor [Paenibacillus polymyxa]MDN4102183.1 response regulator transcription factor [Paenibacillus polymyxa]MDN4112401.1 response regulator transcription factor [Paenibacillus polymyxa]MEE4561845.1 response regulator transcription factor [Paenibacillus polymyxa]SEI90916.1 DNA-binding response regulator, OmpR family, contains REC and winged-helix (wHTH) domain [Paenibacillus polymyxa